MHTASKCLWEAGKLCMLENEQYIYFFSPIYLRVPLYAKLMVVSHTHFNGSGETWKQVFNLHHCEYLKETSIMVCRGAAIKNWMQIPVE